MRPAHAAAASCAVVPPFKKPLIETGGDVREEAQGEGEGEETGVKERWTATRGAATSFGAFNERPFIVPRSSFKLFYYGDWVGDPTRRMLPFIRTTDTLEVQILSYDVLCH